MVSQQKKELRKGKVLVDWSQNDYSKTTVAVYSLRCRERPWASAPLTWEEVEELADDGDPDSVRFEAPRCSSGSPSTATCSRPCSARAGAAGQRQRRRIAQMSDREQRERRGDLAGGDFDAIAERIWGVGDDLVERVGVNPGNRARHRLRHRQRRDRRRSRAPR